MSAENLRTGDVRLAETRDPRVRLVREKFFSLRPRPLERWLWAQGVPAAAERVFWLHWQEGLKRGDWCSEVPIRRVASDCQLDVSTVTRAYQYLLRLGCLRRTDPGRDPHNPFRQATAITEVRVPRELLVELDRHPNRAAPRAQFTPEVTPLDADASPATPSTREPPAAAEPRPVPSGRERLRTLSRLKAAMSPAERRRYDEAFRSRATHLDFDADTKLTPEERAQVLEVLATLAAAPRPGATPSTAIARPEGSRRLSDFELARLRRDIQGATSTASAPELLRQVAWSIEEGALTRFSPAHARHIALKKIREGAWTRPNRMPPNWARPLGAPSVPEPCRSA